MALRSQRAVLANLDRMAGRRIRRMSRAYKEETLGPLVDAILTTESAEDAEKMLGGELLKKMATKPLADAIEAHEVQTGCIGRTTAVRRPRNSRKQ